MPKGRSVECLGLEASVSEDRVGIINDSKISRKARKGAVRRKVRHSPIPPTTASPFKSFPLRGERGGSACSINPLHRPYRSNRLRIHRSSHSPLGEKGAGAHIQSTSSTDSPINDPRISRKARPSTSLRTSADAVRRKAIHQFYRIVVPLLGVRAGARAQSTESTDYRSLITDH